MVRVDEKNTSTERESDRLLLLLLLQILKINDRKRNQSGYNIRFRLNYY